MLAWFLAAVVSAGPPPVLSPQELFKKVSPGVGLVTTPKVLGSAVAIGPTRVVTNWHVVQSIVDPVRVRLGGIDSTAVVVGVDAVRDLAVLQLLSGTLKSVPARRSELPQVGEKAFSVGAPSGLTNTLGDGLVSSIRETDGKALIQTSAPISKGSSGGGLFDERGRLVGITKMYLADAQQLNFAIPTKAVEELMTRLFEHTEARARLGRLSAEEWPAFNAALSDTERKRINELMSPKKATRSDGRETADSPPSLVSTSPTRWGLTAWKDVRFGMGPGDVFVALRQLEPELLVGDWGCVPDSFNPRDTSCLLSERTRRFAVEGEAPSMQFTFAGTELRSVSLQIVTTAPLRVATAAKNESALEWGEPEFEDRGDRGGIWRWQSATMEGFVGFGTRAKDLVVVALKDPSRKSEPPPEPAPPNPTTTEPERWGDEAWPGLRFGMGPGDVVARGPQLPPDFRVRDLRCKQSPGWSKATVCSVAPSRHQYRWGSVQPELEYSFVDGELYQFDLSAWVTDRRGVAKEVKSALVQQWGEPTGTSRDSDGYLLMWNARSWQASLSVSTPPGATESLVKVTVMDAERRFGPHASSAHE